MQFTHPKHNYHWKARLTVCLLILALAFIALVLVNFHAKFAWVFIHFMAFVDGALSLFLFWYLNRGKHKLHTSTFWHQILHWIGVLTCVYLVSIFINTGIIGSNQASLMVLTILALGLFLVGVYTEATFLLVGATLAVFAAGAAFIETYLSVFMLPVLLVTGAVIFVIYLRSRHKASLT